MSEPQPSVTQPLYIQDPKHARAIAARASNTACSPETGGVYPITTSPIYKPCEYNLTSNISKLCRSKDGNKIWCQKGYQWMEPVPDLAKQGWRTRSGKTYAVLQVIYILFAAIFDFPIMEMITIWSWYTIFIELALTALAIYCYGPIGLLTLTEYFGMTYTVLAWGMAVFPMHYVLIIGYNIFLWRKAKNVKKLAESKYDEVEKYDANVENVKRMRGETLTVGDQQLLANARTKLTCHQATNKFDCVTRIFYGMPYETLQAQMDLKIKEAPKIQPRFLSPQMSYQANPVRVPIVPPSTALVQAQQPIPIGNKQTPRKMSSI